MKKLIIIAMLFANSAFALELRKDKPVVCYELEEFTQKIKIQYGEVLQFSYSNGLYNPPTQLSMFSNKETGSWTLIEHNEDFGCVLAVGNNSNL
jgi:hypothetical protein